MAGSCHLGQVNCLLGRLSRVRLSPPFVLDQKALRDQHIFRYHEAKRILRPNVPQLDSLRQFLVEPLGSVMSVLSVVATVVTESNRASLNPYALSCQVLRM